MVKIASKVGNGSAPPQKVTIAPRHSGLAGDLVVADLPVGIHSEHMVELTRLQAWTLKPAKRSE